MQVQRKRRRWFEDFELEELEKRVLPTVVGALMSFPNEVEIDPPADADGSPGEGHARQSDPLVVGPDPRGSWLHVLR